MSWGTGLRELRMPHWRWRETPDKAPVNTDAFTHRASTEGDGMNRDDENEGMSAQDEQRAMRQAQWTRFCVRWAWWGVFLGSLMIWGLVAAGIMAVFWRH